MTSQALSVAICTHNRASDVFECLSALAPQIGDSAIEVLVVDSGSRDDERALLIKHTSRFHFVTLKRINEPGLSRARNLAISAVTGEWIAFLDDDAIPAADWLAHALRLANSAAPHCAIIAGNVLPIFPAAMEPTLGKRWLQMLSTVSQHGESDQTETASVVGANVMFRRMLLLQAGGFAINLGRYGESLLSGEEKLLEKQLVTAGWRIWGSDKLVAGHKISAERLTSKWIEKRAYWDGISDRRIDALMNLSPGYLKVLKAAVSIAILSPLQFVAPARHELPIRLRYNLGWMRELLRLMAKGHPDTTPGVNKMHSDSDV